MTRQAQGLGPFAAARAAARQRHGRDDSSTVACAVRAAATDAGAVQDGRECARALQPHHRRRVAHARQQRQIRARAGAGAHDQRPCAGAILPKSPRRGCFPSARPASSRPTDEPPYDWSVTRSATTCCGIRSREARSRADRERILRCAKLQIPGRSRPARFHPIRGRAQILRRLSAGRPNSQTFTVPDYPKLLHFMADGSLLSLSGDKHISVVSRNVPGMKLEIGRVLPDQLQHLVSFNEGTFANPAQRRVRRRPYRRAVRGSARISQGQAGRRAL
jgi:hypothetical protein